MNTHPFVNNLACLAAAAAIAAGRDTCTPVFPFVLAANREVAL